MLPASGDSGRWEQFGAFLRLTSVVLGRWERLGALRTRLGAKRQRAGELFDGLEGAFGAGEFGVDFFVDGVVGLVFRDD